MSLQPSLRPQVILGPFDAPHTLDLFCMSEKQVTNTKADDVYQWTTSAHIGQGLSRKAILNFL